VNLSKGRIGESNANLLGSMLITKMYLAALSRADMSKAEMKTLPNFYLYVDEFQSFANDSFADILSEARKYKLNLTIAHQYIEQMSDEVRAAVFGNVGTMISFRVGSYDAEVLEKEFAPVFTAEDIVNLGFAQVYLRLMIDGIGSQPFSAKTLPPLEMPEISYVEEIMGHSRQNYARPRAEIEEFIKDLHSNKKADSESKESSDRNNGGEKGGTRNGSSNSGGNSSGVNRGENSAGNRAGNSSGSDFKNNNITSKKSEGKPRTRPVISPDLKNQLEEQLKKQKQIQQEMLASEETEDLSRISLAEMTMNTTNGHDHKKDKKDKGPTDENKNSLKEALSSLLGDFKKEENNKTEIKTEITTEIKTEVKEEKFEQKTSQSKFAHSSQFIKKQTPTEYPKVQKSEPTPIISVSAPEPKKTESKPENSKTVEEIPEEELRKILEI
jgi:hypothetical protein